MTPLNIRKSNNLGTKEKRKSNRLMSGPLSPPPPEQMMLLYPPWCRLEDMVVREERLLAYRTVLYCKIKGDTIFGNRSLMPCLCSILPPLSLLLRSVPTSFQQPLHLLRLLPAYPSSLPPNGSSFARHDGGGVNEPSKNMNFVKGDEDDEMVPIGEKGLDADARRGIVCAVGGCSQLPPCLEGDGSSLLLCSLS